jgi:uncharacterized protein YbaR (Trm112 family)
MPHLLCYTRSPRPKGRRHPTPTSESEDLSLPVLEILRCPACAPKEGIDPGQLALIDGQWLVCRDCSRKYPIRSRIPVLTIEEGNKYRNVPVEELGKP